MSKKLKNSIIIIFSLIMIIAISVICIFIFKDDKKSNNPEQYRVTFYANQQIVKVVESSGNEAIEAPTPIVINGYEFIGWYFDENTWQNEYYNDYYLNIPLTHNTNIYAYYQKIETEEEYTISFIVDGQTVETMQTAGNEILSLPVPEDKDGYTFKGWYFDNNIWNNELTADYFASQKLTQDISVYAYYQKIEEEKYTISFILDGQTVETIQTAGNEVLSLPVPEDKDGYTFKGWYFDNNIWNNKLTADYFASQKLTQDISVYAYYEKDVVLPTEYLVSFETNGGSPIAPITTSLIETSPTTTRDNYTFKGWYADSQFTQIVNFPFEVTKDTTLYAKWEQNIVEVTYNIDSSNYITGISSAPEGDIILNIPSQINGQTVVGIDYGAFKDNTQIVEVYIPDTVTYIFGSAFWGCSNLQKVKLPSSLKSLNSDMFNYCYSLKTIELPDGLEGIGSDAFMNSGLTEISLPDSVKSISQYAFKGCTDLKTINLNKVETLGRGAFEGCTSLQSVIVPETVNYMDHHVFTNCSSLSQIEILSIDAIIHYSIVDYTAYFNNPDNWTNGALYIGSYLVVVQSDYNQSELDVKEGTTVLANFSFTNCSPKTTISKTVLPNSLKVIGESAFENLTNLKTVNIPDSVVKIGDDAFLNTGIYNDNSNWTDNGLYLNHFLIAVKNVNMESFSVKEGTTRIADGQLFDSLSKNITSLYLPDSLVYIGDYNFQYTKITSVILPANLEYIGEEAFYYCSNLTTVDTSKCNNLKSIAYSAFAGCNIGEIYIPKSVVVMGECVFNHNKSIIVNCETSSKPDAWHEEWGRNYTGEITIYWGVKP